MKNKPLILFLALMLCKGISYAAFGDDTLLNRSSYTTTNDGPVAITTTAGGSASLLRAGVFMGVVIASNSAGTVTFFDSSAGTRVSTIGAVSMAGSSAGGFYVPFEVRLSSGLSYAVTTNNPLGISIIYKVTQPY